MSRVTGHFSPLNCAVWIRKFLLILAVWAGLALLMVGGERVDGQSNTPVSNPITIAFQNGAGFLEYNPGTSRLSARTINVPIMEFLQVLHSLTGWDIKAQPNLNNTISTEIEQLGPKESIRSIPWGVAYSLTTRGNNWIQLKIFNDQAASATKTVTGIDLSDQIPDYTVEKIGDELIVRLKPNSKTSIEQIASDLGAEILGSIPELNAYRLKFKDESSATAAESSLKKNSAVSSVDSNYRFSKPDAQGKSYPLPPKRISIKSAPGSSDKTVVIGMIDTAISHSDTQSEFADFLLPQLSVTQEGSPTYSSEITHGSTMFQTMMQGMATTAEAGDNIYDVKVLPVDVYGNSPETNTFLVAQATAKAIENGADIINLSLGGPDPSPILVDVINQGRENGVVFIAAAGNSPVTDPTWPAAHENVLAVTSVTSDGNIAPYANRGNFVDAAAPHAAMVRHNGLTYITSGTSVSTAYISGITAGISTSSGKPVQAVEESIRQNFKP